MERSTAERTEEFIAEHPHIKNCLQRGLINYTALSRYIAQELGIAKSTSIEAILIAARRYKAKLQEQNTASVHTLLAHSELFIRNRMTVVVVEKNVSAERLATLQQILRKEGSAVYVIEGSRSYTVIAREVDVPAIEKICKKRILSITKNVSLVTLKSPEDIEQVPGVIAYLTSLFSENGINIVELMSCWTDTLFILESHSVPKAMQVLKF